MIAEVNRTIHNKRHVKGIFELKHLKLNQDVEWCCCAKAVEHSIHSVKSFSVVQLTVCFEILAICYENTTEASAKLHTRKTLMATNNCCNVFIISRKMCSSLNCMFATIEIFLYLPRNPYDTLRYRYFNRHNSFNETNKIKFTHNFRSSLFAIQSLFYEAYSIRLHVWIHHLKDEIEALTPHQMPFVTDITRKNGECSINHKAARTHTIFTKNTDTHTHKQTASNTVWCRSLWYWQHNKNGFYCILARIVFIENHKNMAHIKGNLCVSRFK